MAAWSRQAPPVPRSLSGYLNRARVVPRYRSDAGRFASQAARRVSRGALESPSRYNLGVKRLLILALLFGCGCWAQQAKPQQEPPEEDEALTPKEYSFNPLQANKELQIGNYYFKRKNYRAAAKRFAEATKWNPTFAEAFLRLGESEDKLKDAAAARQAYSKYLELVPDAKNADDIKKRLTKVKLGPS